MPLQSSPAEVMADLVERADQDLARHHLAEAESSFHSALANIMAESTDKDVHIIRSLSGLAEIYLKRSRSTRHDIYKWHCMYLISLAMQELLIHYCEIAGNREHSETVASFIKEVQAKATHLLNAMEGKLIKSLGAQLCPMDSKTKRRTGSLNLDWLTTLHMFCLTQVKEILQLADARLCDSHSTRDSDASSTDDRNMADFEEPDRVNKPKIDFKRIQTAIMNLVKQISQEQRSHYIREHLPERMLRQSVTSKMMCIMSPEADSQDIALLFEQAVKGCDSVPALQEDQEPESEPQPELVEPTERTWAYPLDRDAKLKLFQQGPKKWQWDSVESESELIQTTADSGDDVNGLPGVLTVWKAYKKVRCTDLPRVVPYQLKIFEELSPLTELGQHLRGGETESNNKPAEYASLVNQASPLNMDAFNFTLARVLTQLADEVKQERELGLACELYKYALGIYEDMGIKGQDFGSVGHILKSLGMIKCQEEDISIGSSLLEEAMACYEKRDNGETSLDIGQVWYEMGVAYMQEGSHEGPLYHHVMEMVQEHYNGIMRQELMIAVVDDDGTDSECSEGETYSLNLREAMDAFNHALAIICKLRRQGQMDHSLYVEVLTKLGDCSIMTGAFDRAILYYEEALPLFRKVQGGTALSNNAHVLSMMGIANFFVGNLPKALTMFNTAHILHQHLCSTDASFEMAFTLTMLGVTYYLQKRYHRSIASCSKAYDIYTMLYGKRFSKLSSLHQWFIAQTLYVLGYCYSTLDFTDKAMYHIELCEDILLKMEEEERDTKLLVKVLKTKADVYWVTDEQENSLYYYQQALECSQSLGDEKSATALQNQLLNSMAGLHVNSKQYSAAAMYLEQALGHQKNMEKSICGDLIGILSQLGMTYSLSGDLDRAIDCYRECVEAMREMVGLPLPRHAPTYGSLATLYHVKACIQDDNDKMVEYLHLSEKHYLEALAIDAHSTVAVQYCNFLHQQGRPADACNRLLPFVFGGLKRSPDVVYHGVEQAILPEHFQHELDDTDEAGIECRVYAAFLALLCFKELRLMQDAEDCLIILYELAGRSSVSISHTILGYALLEMHMYQEAAEAFTEVGRRQPDTQLATTNMWISLCCGAYHQVAMGGYIALCSLLKEQETAPMGQKNIAAASIQDSGYYETNQDEVQRLFSVETALSHPITVTTSADPSYPSLENLAIQPSESNSATQVDTVEEDKEGGDRAAEEGLIETPAEITLDMQVDTESPEEVWHTEAETAATSLATLQIMQQSMEANVDKVSNEMYSSLVEWEEVVVPTDVIVEDDTGNCGGWHTEEVVTSMPGNLLEVLQRQNAEFGGTSHTGEEFGRVCFNEMIKPVAEQQQHVSQPDHEQKYLKVIDMYAAGSEDEDLAHIPAKEPGPEEQEEIWEVFEETVDTPAALLELLKSNYNSGLDNGVAYTEENGNSEVCANGTIIRNHKMTTTSTATHMPSSAGDQLLNNAKYKQSGDESESSESHSMEQVVSMEQSTAEQGSDVDDWQVWEDETMDTPPELLQAILATRGT